VERQLYLADGVSISPVIKDKVKVLLLPRLFRTAAVTFIAPPL